MKQKEPVKKVSGRAWVSIVVIGLAVWVVPGLPTRAQGMTTESRKTPLELRLPPGTILPLKLDHGLSSKEAHAGQAISARIMQNVPLPDGQKIPSGARVRGSVVTATPSTANGGGEMTLRFDVLEVHGRRMAIATSLRAIASLAAVQEAELPQYSIGFGTPYDWAPTVQIGGEIKYGTAGPVTGEETHEVGKGVFDGVLVHVRASENGKCRGALDKDDRLQALWLFSSNACGAYRLDDLEIEHAGRSDPAGIVTLRVPRGDVKLRGGAGMLLRVIAAGGA